MKYHTVHSHTPALTVIDGRGLPIRQVAYLRTPADDSSIPLVTSHEHDVAGRLVAQRDPRLPIANATTVYALNGDALFTDSVDGGWRLILPGLAGEPRQRWDARGHHWQSTFDTQLRVTTLKEDGDPQIDSFSYGESSADASHNLRGQLIRQTDPSGSLDISSYALTGQPLVEKRTFHDQAEFVSHQVFSPLGAVLEQIDGGGHRRASRYGLAGQLKKVELEVETKVTQVLQDAQYNANDQIISQLAGNGVLSQWTYDPADGRLRARISQKPGQPRLQDLAYFYDRVGNIIRIEDHAFEPTWFANQRVDGHREFSYDSLYRLIRATGHDDALPPDIPGLPQPPDERNRLNYIQTYSYDDAGNLTELRHQRDGNSRTRTLCIDDKSNRGVRWQTGDEPPDFGTWFDPHGNQRRLHHGPSLHWNSRDELEHIDLVLRKDSANDAEHYRYSQGVRVFKRHETFAPGANHFHQVRYLPGVEIRTRDNGEELHIISVGNARCLHWVQEGPADKTQLRYTLEDHLGSCVMELDENAAVTSEEGYYPFGETAWMAPESEIAYRFIRYSGKEMDVSGLYYYGARYYAPWLQRWISADPAGDVDGLNLYSFVANNPITFYDQDGQALEDAIRRERPEERDARKAASASQQRQYQANMRLSKAIDRHFDILKLTSRRAQEADQQIDNHRSAAEHGKSAALRTAAHVGGQAVSYAAGIGIGATMAALGSVTGPVGVAFGVFLGVLAKKAVSVGVDYVADSMSFSASVKFKAGKLDPGRIVGRSEYKSSNYGHYALNKFRAIGRGIITLNQAGWLKGAKEVATAGAGVAAKYAAPSAASEASAAFSTLAGTFEILHEIAGAGAPLSPEKVERAQTFINGMIDVLNKNVDEIAQAFDDAGRTSIHTFRLLSKVFGTAPGDTLQSIRRATDVTIGHLKNTQARLNG
jgi:insecticidal toxin complex protein TccC